MDRSHLKVVFFGTPAFAQTILATLIKHQVSVIAVVTRPDKPAHRSSTPVFSDVKRYALEMGIPVFQPTKASDPEFVQTVLAPLKADIFVVAAFSEILKENLLSLPPFGCVNIHASLLPKYRGAAPIQRAIMAGEQESGVTLMAMDIGLDTGGMLKKIPVPIGPDMTAGELAVQLAQEGGWGIVEVLKQLEKRELAPVPQPLEGACYAKKLTSEEGQIRWNRPSQEVYNHIRGVLPKPGAWCEVYIRGESKRLRIHKARHCPDCMGVPGEKKSLKGCPLVICCLQGGVALLEVQLEGKKAMNINDFFNGLNPNLFNFF